MITYQKNKCVILVVLRIVKKQSIKYKKQLQMWIHLFTFIFSFHVFLVNCVVLRGNNGHRLSPIAESCETTHQANIETRYPPFSRSVSANDIKKNSVPHFLKDTTNEKSRPTASTDCDTKQDEKHEPTPNFSRLNLRRTKSLQHITGEIVDLYHHKGEDK